MSKHKTGRKRKQLTLPHVPESKKPRPGNPILAFRVEGPLLRAYVKKHGGREAAYAAIKRHMQTATREARGAS